MVVFFEDYRFRSISSSAQVVSGQTINGRVAWKVKGSDQTYGDWLEQKLESCLPAMSKNWRQIAGSSGGMRTMNWNGEIRCVCIRGTISG